MADSAVLWVSWPKKASGVVTDVTEDVVREVALPLGLVDTKVCAVDDVWSGLKLVVRRELRKTVLSLLPEVAVQDRMPPIPPERMTKAQKRAAAEFVANRKAEVFGPFVPLLRSPEVMLRAMAMGDYLRYRSTLPPRVNELVILITSRHWTQQYEWNLHYADGIKAGLNPTIANAIAERRRPEGMAEDEEIAYELSTELLDERSVSDRTYARAISKFGEQGTMDMVGVVGYYTLLAMVLNTARTPLPAGVKPVLMPFPK
jgi:4-carboxymuconolactone decarboxylase